MNCSRCNRDLVGKSGPTYRDGIVWCNYCLDKDIELLVSYDLIFSGCSGRNIEAAIKDYMRNNNYDYYVWVAQSSKEKLKRMPKKYCIRRLKCLEKKL